MPSNHDIEDSAALALLFMRLAEKGIVDAMDSGVLSAGYPEVSRLNPQIATLLIARTRLARALGYLDTLIENLAKWRDAMKRSQA